MSTYSWISAHGTIADVVTVTVCVTDAVAGQHAERVVTFAVQP